MSSRNSSRHWETITDVQSLISLHHSAGIDQQQITSFITSKLRTRQSSSICLQWKIYIPIHIKTCSVGQSLVHESIISFNTDLWDGFCLFQMAKRQLQVWQLQPSWVNKCSEALLILETIYGESRLRTQVLQFLYTRFDHWGSVKDCKRELEALWWRSPPMRGSLISSCHWGLEGEMKLKLPLIGG